MPATLLFLALTASASAQPADALEPIFACSFGAREVEVVRYGETYAYRFGRPGRAELVLSGDAASGNVHYHRNIYPHGEEQTLRFQNGAYSYVVFNTFQTPDYYQEGAIDQAGLLVLRGGRLIARMICRSGGDFVEQPSFDALPQDEESVVPRR
jgi:hypothetical protein